MKNLTLTTSTGIYYMYANANHRTQITSANGNVICTGAKCILWLLRNKIQSVELWNANHFESALVF